MVTKHVVVLPYDPNWAQAFRAIEAELVAALGGLAKRIEHVGSTSVPGLWAKPIIDIDAVIEDRSLLGEAVRALGKIGYRHEGDLGIPGREAFACEGKTHLMTHHLYVCAEDSSELKRHLAFRDYLRAHPEAIGEYSRVKREAAELFPYDIDAYIAYKSPFIEKIYAGLGLQALSPAADRK
ncbi:MAG: GrpB family protein [Clostridia bacterium]|nr:GrpB family protein [Clostridia bacterium]